MRFWFVARESFNDGLCNLAIWRIFDEVDVVGWFIEVGVSLGPSPWRAVVDVFCLSIVFFF